VGRGKGRGSALSLERGEGSIEEGAITINGRLPGNIDRY